MNNTILIGVLAGLSVLITVVVLYAQRGRGPVPTSDGLKNDDNPYFGLRHLALNNSAEALGLTFSQETTIVYGVVMDLDMSGGVVTIISYRTGDASMYTSTGGGMLGGGKDLNVSNAAKRFVDLSQQYLDKARPAQNTDLPKSGEVIFYLLTNHGIYTSKEYLKNIDDKSSPLIDLFYEANNVINQLRLISVR